jgi:hypothetical protein
VKLKKNKTRAANKQMNTVSTGTPTAALKFLHYPVITEDPAGVRFRIFVDKAKYRFPVSTNKSTSLGRAANSTARAYVLLQNT